MRVVYNRCYGGFGLSKEALILYNDKRKQAGLSVAEWDGQIIDRHDGILLDVVDQLGEKANSKFSKLKITEIPDEYANCYTIREYDGQESVVCDPGRLVQSRLKGNNIKLLTDMECRALLEELVAILG